MKKKLFIFMLLLMSVLGFTACGNKQLNIKDFLIEERNNLFTASDELYSLSLSSGLREDNYALDGIINDKIDFGVVTFLRNDGQPLANDTYAYLITINDEEFNGFLEKSPVDNTYTADLGVQVADDSKVMAKISFTGYTFDQELTNTSKAFGVNKNDVLSIANKELGDRIKEITHDANNKIEVVMKIMKDFSNVDVKNYYWYVGIISTSGETLGILIDASSGEVIAKKV